MNKVVLLVIVAVAIVAGGYAGYRWAHHEMMSAAAAPELGNGGLPPDRPGKPVLYWYCLLYTSPSPRD